MTVWVVKEHVGTMIVCLSSSDSLATCSPVQRAVDRTSEDLAPLAVSLLSAGPQTHDDLGQVIPLSGPVSSIVQ